MTPSLTTPAPCPLCDSAHTRLLGPILHPHPPKVAGVVIDLGDTAFSLRACERCGFWYKDPPIPHDALLACYGRASTKFWMVPDAHERRFDQWRDILTRFIPRGRALDVGCFTGDFILSLGSDWSPFGVEPGSDAADLCRSRGIQILGSTLDDIAPINSSGLPAPAKGFVPFDAILALDVVEHVARPKDFLAQISALLRPAGVFLLVTGDTDGLSWRLQGSRHWYCSLAEHISFYNRRCLAYAAPHVGMEVVHHAHTSHIRARASKIIEQGIKNWVYVVMNRLGGLGLPPLRRLFVDRRAPNWVCSRDHMVAVLRKTSPSP